MSNLIFIGILLLSMMCASTAVAQTLKGKVIDASSGEPLVGASIGQPSTGNGCASDFEGAFELTLAELPASIQV
ncbi:MAG: carboxypeptidase-like regulatory domain-containing protein, partial [Flavobacteriales bacterium]